ncbi:STAS domain-containing protein [Pseudomonas typographi]|uniref:STAS domain-containing protein n=1 Tax=Pseudomonas typographi TaxID=2715964 RepID=A0ABR7YXI1_9PSED|nr:STAS domain-containing protein [Pseudomonas typographi]MBD1550935.1 STAS domain-containing protein [Pseudomonas typographi]MBD1585760.1 STAS domain-containing protein [Pseudomonas typographi]MBD1597834.1 STAS domain-containing protein [Pseudomonas typographi]
MTVTVLAELLQQNETALLDRWIAVQRAAGIDPNRLDDRSITDNARDLLHALVRAISEGGDDIEHPQWRPVKQLLERLSHVHSQQGFPPTETATFVLSLKEPLFRLIQKSDGNTIELLWACTRLFDQLGLFTMQAYMASREQVIREQQESMLELSTPVVQLWKGVLAVPLIGSLDSNRTQVVMEALLQKIVDTESDIAIIDITGVPTVDTMVAQHLLKTITAAKLMGAKCIISGIRPQIAATIVHLGVELGDVVTKASLADAFQLALRELNVRLVANRLGA